MNHKLLMLLCGVAIGGVGSWAIFYRSPEPSEKDAGSAATPTENKPDAPGITLTSAQVMQTSIKTELPHAVKLRDERKGFAQVLDPSTLLNGFAEITLAEANSAASEKESLRLKTLHENGDNASGQAADAAALAAERDRIQLSTSLAKIKAVWGAWATTDAARQRLTTQLNDGSFLRIDFAGSETSTAEGKIVSLSSFVGGDAVIARAEIFSPATSIDAQFQGQSFWAIVSGQTLPVGANFEARLILENSSQEALAVPANALLRQDGKIFLYIQISPEKFFRKNVKILQRIADDDALSGVEASDRVVTVGAQQLLSAELNNEGSGD